MSVSTLVQIARDFAGHTSSTPPQSYFDRLPPLRPLLDDPWDGMSEDDLALARRWLLEDTARRKERDDRGLRTGSASEMRRLGLLAGSVA